KLACGLAETGFDPLVTLQAWRACRTCKPRFSLRPGYSLGARRSRFSSRPRRAGLALWTLRARGSGILWRDNGTNAKANRRPALASEREVMDELLARAIQAYYVAHRREGTIAD